MMHLPLMNIIRLTVVTKCPIDDRNESGEIVICIPEARRRAAEHGTRVRNELLLYALHGMLHLCGMDDRTQKGFERMHRMEDRILTKLGLGAVFQTRPLKRARQGPCRKRTG